jgi:hypothetical protein
MFPVIHSFQPRLVLSRLQARADVAVSQLEERTLTAVAQFQIRATVALLQLLLRVLNTRPFRWAMRTVLLPIVTVWLVKFLVTALYGTPRIRAEPGSQVEQLLRDLQAKKSTRLSAPSDDRDRPINQTITWGPAGAAVLILAAIVTSSKLGPALLMASGCFALAIPLLVVVGLVYASRIATTSEPLTVQEVLNVATLQHAAHFVWFLGFATLLWSYDWRVSICFVVGCYLAWRCFRAFIRPSPSPKSENAGPT